MKKLKQARVNGGSRTVLLPTVEAPRDPGEFRPISIANAYARLFHKLLYSRLSPVAPMRETQKAFRKVHVTAANLVVLDTLLRDARTRLKQPSARGDDSERGPLHGEAA